MITAEFFKAENGLLAGFCIKGHALYSDTGSDIVCSAVSSAAYMAANTITEIIHADADVSVTEEGEMLLTIQEQDAERCSDILFGLKLHLAALEEQYPENMRVK